MSNIAKREAMLLITYYKNFPLQAHAHHETSNFYHLFRKLCLTSSFSLVLLPFPLVEMDKTRYFGSFFLLLYTYNYVAGSITVFHIRSTVML